ncbi:MAG: hypothetical protein RDV48_26700 [Candidatus Eremiobacteraeota bacterium]|nr:hypothetical protein [Candidatus Eremiobacteraeota bacterium]
MDKVQELVGKNPTLVKEAVSPLGWTPLRVAGRQQFSDMIKVLRALGGQ